MRKRIVLAGLLLALAACSPSTPTDPRAVAGAWPPKDFKDFTARPPRSVGAELDDPWNMAIDAERWSYLIGIAIVAAGGTPPMESEGANPTAYLDRTATGLHDAATRLIALHALTCGSPPIAKAEDCTAFSSPLWANAIAPASKDELQARLQWLESNAYRFTLPACAVAIKRTGDDRYCAVE